jgi:uncharacterized protein YpuA (DUF1002 family)
MDNEVCYGVDLNKEVTPIEVRDAVVKCFISAHGAVLEDMKDPAKDISDQEFNNMKKMNVELLIKNMFKEIKGDYENPNRQQLMEVLDKLKEFAKNFRNPEIVKRHYEKIMKLVEKLD